MDDPYESNGSSRDASWLGQDAVGPSDRAEKMQRLELACENKQTAVLRNDAITKGGLVDDCIRRTACEMHDFSRLLTTSS